MGPPLGIGGPGECVSLSVSFSHRRVGSSILASLSEAGGNESRKVTSKPLPPRSPLSTTRHVKRTHAGTNARSAPMSGEYWIKSKSFISKYLGDDGRCGKTPESFRSFSLGWNEKLKREEPRGECRWRVGSGRLEPVEERPRGGFYYPGNGVIRLPALWVFRRRACKLLPCVLRVGTSQPSSCRGNWEPRSRSCACSAVPSLFRRILPHN
jgi:hypothetical protein